MFSLQVRLLLVYNLLRSKGGPMEVLRVLIVEEHSLFAEALGRSLIARRPEVSVTIRATKRLGEQALADAQNAHESYDLIIIDKVLPDGNGCDLIAGARRSAPCTDVFVLFTEASADAQLAILAAGAVPLVMPLREPGHLLEYGRRRQLVLREVVEVFASSHNLSPCQTDVLRETVSSCGCAAVMASSLGISKATLATHWKRIFDKTGARSQMAVVVMLFQFLRRHSGVTRIDYPQRQSLGKQ